MMRGERITERTSSTWCLSIAFLIAMVSSAYAQENTVTFDNQSGEQALVKLIGPTYQEVAVPSGEKKNVTASAGRYHIKVQYGTSGKYRYTKGEEFDVASSSTTSSQITITLHKISQGNYQTRKINAQEFEQANPAHGSIQSGTQIGNYFLVAEKIPSEKTSTTRCAIEMTPDGKFNKLTTNLGAGYEFEYTGGPSPDIFSPGAEITMLGNAEWYGYRFHPNSELPLVFKVVKGKGIVYLSGKGKVVASTGQEHSFGSDMTPDKCIAALKSTQQLTREGAAQALGYLKAKNAVDTLIIALKDPSIVVQRNVIESLGKIAEPKALPTLQNEKLDGRLSKVVKEAINRIQVPSKNKS